MVLVVIEHTPVMMTLLVGWLVHSKVQNVILQHEVATTDNWAWGTIMSVHMLHWSSPYHVVEHMLIM